MDDIGKAWTKNKNVLVKSLSHVRFFVTPWTVAHQAPPFMGFSRQEYWSGLPFPPEINMQSKKTERLHHFSLTPPILSGRFPGCWSWNLAILMKYFIAIEIHPPEYPNLGGRKVSFAPFLSAFLQFIIR